MFSKTFALSLVALSFVPSFVAACSPGSYKLTRTSTQCAPCKAGTYDSSNGQGVGQTSCDTCNAGYFSNAGAFGNSNSQACTRCGAGTFSEEGSGSCCTCCAGYYSSAGAGSCTRCPIPTRRYSPPGSDSSNDCVASGPTSPVANGQCEIGGDNTCPAVVPGGPEGSQVKKRRDVIKCTRGYESCPLLSGRNGFECVDTKNDPEMCGGCVGPNGEGDGVDCTAIKGISVARCVRSQCVIDKCRRGFTKNLDGSSCVSVSRLSVQQPGQKRKN